MSEIRMGLIGCGRWGRNIARVLAGQGVLAAVGVRRPEAVRELAEGWGAEAMTPEALLRRNDLAAVAIATPPSEHPRLALAALAAGRHVFVEKPLALSAADARACAQAAKAAGRVLMAGHIMLYNPAFTRLAQLAASGAVGRVRRITAERFVPFAGTPDGNALWMLAPHDVSMVLRLAGPPEAVEARREGEDWRLRLALAGGAAADIRVGRAAPKRSWLAVEGEDGTLVFEDAAPAERRLRLDGAPVPFTPGEPLAAEMAAFLRAVRGPAGSAGGADEAVAVIEVLERAELSAR